MYIYCDCTSGCKRCGRENELPIIDIEKLMLENEAYKQVLETRREHETKADERYYELCEENKRLRGALESIAKGMVIVPSNKQAEGVVGYFVGFAEAVLKGKGS